MILIPLGLGKAGSRAGLHQFFSGGHTQLARQKLRQQRGSQRVGRAGFFGRNRATLIYPNGVTAFSPGLRGTSYPGKASRTFNNPEGVAATGAYTIDATPLGLGEIMYHVSQRSRWAATLGWMI
jgi:hypothetical protein